MFASNLSKHLANSSHILRIPRFFCFFFGWCHRLSALPSPSTIQSSGCRMLSEPSRSSRVMIAGPRSATKSVRSDATTTVNLVGFTAIIYIYITYIVIFIHIICNNRSHVYIIAIFFWRWSYHSAYEICSQVSWAHPHQGLQEHVRLTSHRKIQVIRGPYIYIVHI